MPKRSKRARQSREAAKISSRRSKREKQQNESEEIGESEYSYVVTRALLPPTTQHNELSDAELDENEELGLDFSTENESECSDNELSSQLPMVEPTVLEKLVENAKPSGAWINNQRGPFYNASHLQHCVLKEIIGAKRLRAPARLRIGFL
jgi:hypothetical protein